MFAYTSGNQLTTISIMLALWLAALTIGAPLAQEKSVQSEVVDVIEALKGYSQEQRDEALEAAKQAIADLDVRIAEPNASSRKIGKA